MLTRTSGAANIAHVTADAIPRSLSNQSFFLQLVQAVVLGLAQAL